MISQTIFQACVRRKKHQRKCIQKQSDSSSRYVRSHNWNVRIIRWNRVINVAVLSIVLFENNNEWVSSSIFDLWTLLCIVTSGWELVTCPRFCLQRGKSRKFSIPMIPSWKYQDEGLYYRRLANLPHGRQLGTLHMFLFKRLHQNIRYACTSRKKRCKIATYLLSFRLIIRGVV